MFESSKLQPNTDAILKEADIALKEQLRKNAGTELMQIE